MPTNSHRVRGEGATSLPTILALGGGLTGQPQPGSDRATEISLQGPEQG